MTYREMYVKLMTKKCMARLPHWNPSVYISFTNEVITYDDGELFLPTTQEKMSNKWEVIESNSVEEQMRKDYGFARMFVLKVASTRYTQFLHRLNTRLTDYYIERDVFAHTNHGYAICLEDGEWKPKLTSNIYGLLLVKANKQEVVEQAIVDYECLLNYIGEANLDLLKIRSCELEIEELIELYYKYK